MRIHIVIALVILGVLLPVRQPRADAADEFALACTFTGGRSSFVVNGDYVKGEATLSHSGGTRGALVRSDFKYKTPKLAVLVRGQGKNWEWRDLYIIDTALGTFTHVNEQYADGPGNDPSIAVQGGTCTSPR
jgi:hypothetical protein